VALQGDIQSFALPDVLRLLAATSKSGLLEVNSAEVSGAVGLDGGQIVHGALGANSPGQDPVEVLYELLKLEEGAFAFDEGEQSGDEALDIEAALSAVDDLEAEWAEIQAVVPTMDAWVSLMFDDGEDELTLTAREWRTVVTIGSGATVGEIAQILELDHREACRSVISLGEADLIQIAESAPEGSDSSQRVIIQQVYGSSEPATTYEGVVAGAPDTDWSQESVDELAKLGTDDRQVKLEDSDDPLLPEPLPGEGVAFEGEEITGSVDGREFDVSALLGDSEDASPDHEAELDVDPDTEAGDVSPFHLSEVALESVEGESDAAISGDNNDTENEDERGSLLKFLSSVNP